MTQQQFGELIGVTQQTVSDLLRREVIAQGASCRDWLLDYCDHLREMAAGRGGESGAELTAARARLAREQADKVAMQNAVMRSELAPVSLIEEVIARAASKAVGLLEAVPGELRRSNPRITAEDLMRVRATIGKCRNLISKCTLEELRTLDEEDLRGPADQPSAYPGQQQLTRLEEASDD